MIAPYGSAWRFLQEHVAGMYFHWGKDTMPAMTAKNFLSNALLIALVLLLGGRSAARRGNQTK